MSRLRSTRLARLRSTGVARPCSTGVVRPCSTGVARPCSNRLAPLCSTGILTFILILAVHGSSQARSSADPSQGFGRGPSTILTNREPNLFLHNAGNLTLYVTNMGVFGVGPWEGDVISAGWRGGEYLYQGGLWVGAIAADGEAHVSTSHFPSNEFRPSLLPVDTIYESYEGVRGGLRPGVVSGDDDRDGLLDEDFLNGKDDDGDGEIDEDYAAVGQQMLSCEYRDNTPESMSQNPDHRPLGLLVQQRSFQWATAKMNEFVGVDFRIMNIGDQRLANIYIGFFVDADAGPKTAEGYWTDDLVGYARLDSLVQNPTEPLECRWQRLSMDIAYIWDAPDNGSTVAGGDVSGYFGAMFLGHTTDPTGVKAPVRVGLTTVKWTSLTGAYPEGDPVTDVERYDLLSRGGIPRRNATKPNDYRFTLAAGPFAELDPGDDLTFQTAFVIGEGLIGMAANAASAQRVFNGVYVDGDNNRLTGVGGRERCLHVLDRTQEILWDDPCDTLVAVIIRTKNQVCTEEGVFVDDDCNVCTGRDGKEMLLNWVGTTAPPPPHVNTDPDMQRDRLTNPNGSAQPFADPPSGDRQVLLKWDNASELRLDPLSGRNLFEGYRIWRVDEWQRPEGSVGPTPEEWMLVAEFRLHPRDGLGVRSSHHLKAVTTDLDDVKELGPNGKPQYYVGRYAWPDTNGLTNGKIYFYGITAFGLDTLDNLATGERELIELSGAPAAIQKELVVTSWAPGRTCDDVKVVPNPYRGGADWDLNPSDCDPTGTKIAFRSLPANWTRLSVFTLAGDLVLAAEPSDSRVVGACEVGEGNRQEGTFFWDLVSRSGQNVVAGIYLYSVEAPETVCRGRFVIIR